MAGHEDDGQVGTVGSEPVGDLGARRAGQHDIGEEQVEVFVLDRERFLPVRRKVDVVAGRDECAGYEPGDQVLVLDDQDAACSAGHG